MPRVLIVEDEALIALDLQLIVEAFDPSHQVWTEASVAEALPHLDLGIDFAF